MNIIKIFKISGAANSCSVCDTSMKVCMNTGVIFKV